MLKESNRSLHFIVVRHGHQLICLLKVDFVFNNKSNPPTLKSGDLHFTPETFPDQNYAVPFNEEKALIWAEGSLRPRGARPGCTISAPGLLPLANLSDYVLCLVKSAY